MMEAMNLVEVVLNQGNEEDIDKRVTQASDDEKVAPIKGLDESVSITVTRTPGKPNNVQRQSGKPANFALLSSPVRNGRNSDAIRVTPREEMVCNGCQRTFKYKAAFVRHETQCGLPLALRIERAAVMEAKRAEKAAEVEKRKIEEKQEKPDKPPLMKCPTCLKQFYDNDAFKNHDFQACAAERSTYTFICDVCKARFKYKNHLRRHEDSHNNVRRYNCEVCTTAFLRPDHLKRHMMRMHGIVQLSAQSSVDGQADKSNPGPGVESTSEEKNSLTPIKNAPMQCPMCSKILSRRDHVLRHMRNVHHINYETRKRGGGPVFLNGSQSMMDQNGMNPCEGNGCNNEDVEEGENQSVASHDGLMIDESFESVKKESLSPTLEKSNDPLYRVVSYGSSTARNPMDDSYLRNETFLKHQNYHYRPCDGVRIKSESNPVEDNFMNCNSNNINNDGSILRAPDRFGLHSVPSHEPARHDPHAEMKMQTQPIENTDGNQSVSCNGGNGLTARMAGTNWMSDLTSYSGW